MSRRPSTARTVSQGGTLRLDRLASDHVVFKQVLRAIVEAQTTSEELRPEDFDGANEAIAQMLPDLVVRVDQFFPAGVELPKADGAELSPASMLFPVSKGNRKEDIAQAIRFMLPRTLNDLIKGLSDALSDELKQLQYLGPLRSFPPRHLAFAEYEDSNWYAGGGYAWDVVRRNDAVREAVNVWLASGKLKTPYKLVVRTLVALDHIDEPISKKLGEPDFACVEGLTHGREWIEIAKSSDDEPLLPQNAMDHLLDVRGAISDPDRAAAEIIRAVEESGADRIRELVLIDQRANTIVTHRDVGIGISQVLPVLVMAYASNGKLLAMEQPEIHLHPALQAELGDVFIDAALGVRKNTFILETHSEHLILRLLRRIRETTDGDLPEGATPIRPDDLAVIYVRPAKNGSEIVEIVPTPEGDFLTSWPDGFFAERAQELFG
jgi:hypothetical protein